MHRKTIVLIVLFLFVLESFIYARDSEYKQFATPDGTKGKWVYATKTYEYDPDGRCTYAKIDDDWGVLEWTRQYDSRGNLIHEKYNDGEELFFEYDDHDNLVFEKDIYYDVEKRYEYTSYGLVYSFATYNKADRTEELICEYYPSGLKSYEKKTMHEWKFYDYTSTVENWYHYDNEGNIIQQHINTLKLSLSTYTKEGEAPEELSREEKSEDYWFEYDENGNLVHENKGQFYQYSYKYDSHGNCIEKTDKTRGDVTTFTYDNKGNLLVDSTKYPGGSIEEWSYSYDSYGNQIYAKRTSINNKGKKEEREYFETYLYDSKGNVVYYKDSKGNETYYEYTYYDDTGRIKKEVTYLPSFNY